MAEMAKRGKGKGTGKEGSDGPHPFKGKGKGQPQGGKGKGPGKGPASASAVRLDPVLETAYQIYLAGRRPDQPRVSRNAWLRNNLRSDSTLRAELRGRMQAAHSAPVVGAQPAAAPKGELGSATPRQPPPPPKTRPRGPTGARNPQSTAVPTQLTPPKTAPPAQPGCSSSGTLHQSEAAAKGREETLAPPAKSADGEAAAPNAAVPQTRGTTRSRSPRRPLGQETVNPPAPATPELATDTSSADPFPRGLSHPQTVLVPVPKEYPQHSGGCSQPAGAVSPPAPRDVPAFRAKPFPLRMGASGLPEVAFPDFKEAKALQHSRLPKQVFLTSLRFVRGLCCYGCNVSFSIGELGPHLFSAGHQRMCLEYDSRQR